MCKYRASAEQAEAAALAAGPALLPVAQAPSAPPQNEQQFRLVIEAAPNAMIMVNQHGLILLVNSQAEKLFGYSRQELLGNSVEMLVPERFRANHGGYRGGFFGHPDTRAMGAGRDLYGLKKCGAEVPIEIGLNPLHMPEGVCVLASIIDITERKRAEERLRLVVEAAPNAMLMINAQGDIVLVNSQVEKLFGYTRQELLGQAIELLIPERYRQHHGQYRDSFFQQPDTRAMGAGRDLFGLKKDGSEVPIEIGLNPLHTGDGHFVLASVIDITERMHADKLQRATQMNTLRQSILDCLPFSIIATSTDGVVLTVNPAAERLLGFPRQELVGQSALLIHDARELARRASELSQQVGVRIPANFQVIVASGSRSPLRNAWSAICAVRCSSVSCACLVAYCCCSRAWSASSDCTSLRAAARRAPNSSCSCWRVARSMAMLPWLRSNSGRSMVICGPSVRMSLLSWPPVTPSDSIGNCARMAARTFSSCAA